MLYEVRMKTTYEYARSAAGGRHLLRLMPSEISSVQRMVAGVLEISPQPRERYDNVDFFGNRTTGVVFAEAHDQIEFVVRARVERKAPPAPVDVSPPLDALRTQVESYRSLGADAPHHFLAPSPLVSPSPAIGAYARGIVAGRGSVLDSVDAINCAIHADMRYDPEATTVETHMDEAFAARHGVCQDFSHIMIACLREVGIPALYVSGFLRTKPPEGRPRLEGADAMHAWVGAWCGTELGWIEFDPTNDMRVSSDHIVVARGRDYSDVAPVKGVLWTAGSQTTRQAVDVIPLD
ncbi:transglutaminase family protein [Mesorhizobium sp. CAU 1741]|uniref:transglutaminase family protein n=1 Tax=Mesorhizobium sp. CAU 1741 TaxID=3140366 RepID=UPI00325B64FB